MRYRVKRYQAWTGLYSAEVGNYLGMNFLNVPDWVLDQLTFVGSYTIDEASQRYIMESFRLVANETRGGYVVLSTGQKLPYLAMTAHRGTGSLGNYISIYIAISALVEAADGDEDDLAAIAAMEQVGGTLTDQFTIEMDWGDEPTGLSGGDAAEQVKDFFHIVKDGDTVKVITEDGGEEVVVPVELATEAEVKDINDDVMGALYGYGKVAVTIHSLMRIGTAQNSESAQNSENAQSTGYVTQDLASVIYVDPEKTWAENGYPTLYDDEGTSIDTTSNPAAGDEVFNYQIQSES